MYEEGKRGYSIRDILIQLLFIVLFIFLLVWLFPTKSSVNSALTSVNNKLNALTSSIYNQNLSTMKEAAVSYYTTERLPQNINDVKSMTLQQMIDNKLLVEFKDGNGNSCNLTKSYVQVVKLNDEYQMKINLSCTDNDAYIIVHLGCYDYCQATGVCEKEETPTVTKNTTTPTNNTSTTCSYEYKLVTNGKWGEYGDWSSWITNKVDATDYRQVDTKTEQVITGTTKVQTGTKTETVTATKSTTTFCPSGYVLNSTNDMCVQSTTTFYYSKCSAGYTLNNGVCYGTAVTTITTDPTCPSGYSRSGTTCFKYVTSQYSVKPTCPTAADGTAYSLVGDKCYYSTTATVTMTPSCPTGYSLSADGATCSKNVNSGGTVTYEKGTYIRTTTSDSPLASNEKYYYEYVGGGATASCYPNCTAGVGYTYDVYSTVPVYSGGTTVTLKTSSSCATNYTLNKSDGKCYKTGTATDVTDAACPTNYSLISGACYKNITTTDTTAASCPSGYNISGTMCYTSSSSTVTKSPSCPTGYTLNASGTKCYPSSGTSTTNVLTSVSYSCPAASDGNQYTLNGSNCTRVVPVYTNQNTYSNVTYYRYRERTYISGTVSVKWSNSQNDTTLINQGYSLTGNKKCS